MSGWDMGQRPPAAPVPGPSATLGRTFLAPAIALRFAPGARHAATGQPLATWVRALPSRTWDPERARWVVTATGPGPEAMLREAGFTIWLAPASRDARLAGITSLDQLAVPAATVDEVSGEALIYPRLAGYQDTLALMPAAATWDRHLRAFRATCTDLLPGGQPLPGLLISRKVRDAAGKAMARRPAPPALAEAAALARSAGGDTQAESVLVRSVGDVPAWFGMRPYPYQRAGAIAIAAGHSLLCDEPGVGKTVTSLAAAAILGARRILILCPAKVVSSWQWHVTQTRVATAGGSQPGDVVVIRSGRKQPLLPEAGAVIISDQLAASRGALRADLAAWQPDVLICDESHRAKTWESARAQAARQLAAATTMTAIAVSGTPMLASPAELASQLEITGHLGPVFGGLSAFMSKYCYRNPFNAWVARKRALPELRQRLDQQVWVRRRKADVLPDLPPKSRHPMIVDVPLAGFRQAHRDVSATIRGWLTTLPRLPDPGNAADKKMVQAWARGQIGLMSPLRVAAGLAKVPAAAEFIAEWASTTVSAHDGHVRVSRPLVAWVHHREVAEALIAAARQATGDQGLVRSITGATSQAEADEAVDAFQAGQVAILIASITAAGVGITLTRGSDALFVETTYTPAEITQAEDRLCRVGQERPVTCLTMIAPGTLDERIQEVLDRKSQIVGQVLAGSDTQVAVIGGGQLAEPGEIIAALAWDEVAAMRT